MVHQSLKWNFKKGWGGEGKRWAHPTENTFPPKPLLWPLTLKYGRNVTTSCMPTFVCQWHHPSLQRFILCLSLSVQHNHYHNHNWKCSSSSFLPGNLLAWVWIPLSEAMQQNIAFYKWVLSKNLFNHLHAYSGAVQEVNLSVCGSPLWLPNFITFKFTVTPGISELLITFLIWKAEYIWHCPLLAGN